MNKSILKLRTSAIKSIVEDGGVRRFVVRIFCMSEKETREVTVERMVTDEFKEVGDHTYIGQPDLLAAYFKGGAK